MKNQLLELALPMIIKIITSMLTAENVQRYTNKLFDIMEEFIEDTTTPIDNAALPIIRALRAALLPQQFRRENIEIQPLSGVYNADGR